MNREDMVRALPDVDVPLVNGLRNGACADISLPIKLFQDDTLCAAGRVTLPALTKRLYEIATFFFIRELASKGINPVWNRYQTGSWLAPCGAERYTQNPDGVRTLLEGFPTFDLDAGWKLTQELQAPYDLEKCNPVFIDMLYEPLVSGLLNQYASVEVSVAPAPSDTISKRISSKIRHIGACVLRIF